MKPIRILLYFAVWGRHDVLRVCLEGVKRLVAYDPERFEIIPFAVCSTDEDAAILEEHSINYCMFENTWLGAKKNFGLSRAIQLIDFDYMLEIGSDDLIANKLLDLYEPYLQEGAKLLSLNSCYFIETATGRVAFWESELIIGAGRMIHISVLKEMFKYEFRFTQSVGGPDIDYRAKQVVMLNEKSARNYEFCNYGIATGNTGFNLWDSEIQSGLDTNSHQIIISETSEKDIQVKTNEPLVIDLKSGHNIHGFENFKHSEMSLFELLKNFSKKEYDMIACLNADNALSNSKQPKKAKHHVNRTAK